MEEEVKIAKMDIHVKTAEPEVGIEPLVIVQVNYRDYCKGAQCL